MSATRNRLVDAYLDDLRDSLRDLPRKQREELIAEVSSHLEATIPLGASQADVLTALDRFGDPERIADAERERLGLALPAPGWREWLAIPLLLVGGVVLPVLGWLIGVLLLWLSRCWSARDKLIATLVVPGGLLPAIYLALFDVSGEVCRTRTLHTQSGQTTVSQVCTGGMSTSSRIAVIALELFLIVAPIATAVYLGRRLQTRRSPS
jgi:hypothetical protein